MATMGRTTKPQDQAMADCGVLAIRIARMARRIPTISSAREIEAKSGFQNGMRRPIYWSAGFSPGVGAG